MARDGSGQSEWQRVQAAQAWQAEASRRAAERQAREEAGQARAQEKLRQQQHVQTQQQAAEARAAEVGRQVSALDEVLTSVLATTPVSFDHLRKVPQVPPFHPGSLDRPAPAPDWQQYAPAEPKGLAKLFGGARRHQRQLADAHAWYKAATADYRDVESHRRQS